MIRTFLIACTVGVTFASAIGENRITLRSSARVDAGAAIVLADVATIDGPDAIELGSLVVSEEAGQTKAWVKVDAETVRQELDDIGFNPGRFSLSGSSCAVRFVRGRPAESKANTRTAAPERVADDTDTVRGAVVQYLARTYSVSPADLRISFRASDEDVLSHRIGDHRLDVKLASSGNSKRIQMKIFMIGGSQMDQVMLDESITADVSIYRPVLVARSDIARGQPLDGAQIDEVSQWINAGESQAPSLDEVRSTVASRSVKPGEVITSRHIEHPEMIKRGDVVSIVASRGGIRLDVNARAMQNGRKGEVILFKMDGADRKFPARVGGVGVAVLNLDVLAARTPRDLQ